MGNQQGPEAQNGVVPHHGPDEYEEEGQGHAGDNVRVGHGDVGYGQDEGPEPGPHPVDAQGGGSAHHRGQEAGEQGHFQGVTQKGQELIVPKQLSIPHQGEAFKIRNVLAGVEGGHHEDEHGQVQEEENQDGVDFV